MLLRHGQFIVMLVITIHYTTTRTCRTEAGLSMILYLKVPECIQKLPDPSELGGAVDINHASGVVDGYTYFTWGNNNMRDVVALRPVTEEYVKPELELLLFFQIG